MKKFGLIGYPLEHSFSKKFFEEKFGEEQLVDHTYHLYPLPFIESVLPLIGSEPELCGLNVTIPYKAAVMEFLNEVDDIAKAIGAVNCIKITGGHLKGYNTDASAFKESLQGFLTATPEQAFVLGTGGSSLAACFILKELGIPYIRVSRQAGDHRIRYNDILKNMKHSNLFVNTTPVGQFPIVEEFPNIPYSKLTESDFLFDLVYNPEETEFLKRGKARGAQAQNGLKMLHLQAEKSWEIWNTTE